MAACTCTVYTKFSDVTASYPVADPGFANGGARSSADFFDFRSKNVDF